MGDPLPLERGKDVLVRPIGSDERVGEGPVVCEIRMGERGDKAEQP